MKERSCAASLLAVVILASCAPVEEPRQGLSVDYEKYVLDNGLEVILHVDRSDPVAAVAMTFHVGSAREVEGKTGFAHLFEHLFFLDSENLGPGGLDRLMTRAGSSTNGFTSNDQTTYFEVVPTDGLEKALWAESDKLGFFINTVTESVVAKEKQVVKNEKRQGVDNRPYGHANFVIDKALYPEGHPYSWQVIGSLDDLDAATLDDVQQFHGRWYGPNNATLVVAGDIDVEAAKAWIDKYFSEIPAVEAPDARRPDAVHLEDSKRLVHEDNFANLPQLTLSWPTVQRYEPDAYPLRLLADLLADGKTAPLYEVLVEEEKLTPGVTAVSRSMELAGRFDIRVRAFPEIDLDAVASAIESGFHRFADEGVAAEDLARVKARYETSFYGNLSSALGKAFQLAQYNIFAGSPGYVEEDIAGILSVTEADILRVFETYIRGHSFVAASFVPKGQPELAVEGSERAEVVEETIVEGAETEVSVADRGEIPRTDSSFDRSVEPPFGPAPTLAAPEVWQAELTNGLRLFGIEDRELPLVQFELRLKGGLLLEAPGRVGVANLLAETLTEGTAQRTAKELEQAIDALGATVSVSAERESLVLGGSCLARNYAPLMKLVTEIVLEPRWDVEELELARQRVLNGLRQRASSPFSTAEDAFNELLYGEHVLASGVLGGATTVESVSIEDLQEYYRAALVPGVAAFHVAGALTQGEVVTSLARLEGEWQAGEVVFPPAPGLDVEPGLFFVDVPGAKQSVIYIGRLALAETDDEFHPATVMNFRLGGGGFASDLMQVLREEKGYTYGISSGFSGSDIPGAFAIRSSVRSNVTLEALEIVLDLLERHGAEFDAADLEATQGFLLRNNAMAFETLRDKLGILADMSAYGLSADFLLERETTVREMTVERVAELAERHLGAERMVWLVVGDAETQMPRLQALGLGEPQLIPRPGA